MTTSEPSKMNAAQRRKFLRRGGIKMTALEKLDMLEANRCTASKTNGERCGMGAVKSTGLGLCWKHGGSR